MLQRVWQRWLRLLLLVLVCLFLLGALAGIFVVRASFPRTQGVLVLEGLRAPVDVYRSGHGVPTIIASNEYDLFFTQGYVHAQDRFYQMDFFRHVGTGTTAEMFGETTLDTDVFLQTLGWEQIASAEAEDLDPDSRAILQAYADGVNAYLADHEGASLSLEYAILSLIQPSYSVEPWSIVHSLAWAKSMAWDLGGNLDGEIDRALLLNSLSMEQLTELYPPYPEDHPVIVPSLPMDQAQSSPIRPDLPLAAIHSVSELDAQINDLLGLHPPGQEGLGSNNWVISGDRSASGGALFANDTHLGIQMPSIWYENALLCRSLAPDCRYRVAGFSFAAAPGVVIGHNDYIAWGVTNTGPDVQDLYVERLHPEDPDLYLSNGEWVEMEIVEEVLQVAGADPIPLTVRRTRHGPVISDTYGRLEDLAESDGLDLPPSYAISLAWTALEPSTVMRSILELNRARDFEEFRAALKWFDVPAQNFVYADIAGNIGYQMTGQIPVRRSGEGWLPTPGWDGTYDWQGYLTFEQLPWSYNPASGYIITANHAVVDRRYPHFITRQWDYGFRAQRIVDLVDSTSTLDLEALKRIQVDNLNPAASLMLPYLAPLEFEKPVYQQWINRLQRWDGRNDPDSAEAALFNMVWQQAVNRVFHGEWEAGPLPQDSRAIEVMRRLLDQPDSAWWDEPTTAETESRDDVLRVAFLAAFGELEASLGTDPNGWAWGELHTATFRNQSLGQSGVPPIEALFNRGPFPVGGGASILNATDWDLTEGAAVTSLPSQRIVLDLSDLDGAQTIHTTGQSGHAFHANYIDLARPWAELEYHQLAWEFESIVTAAASHLRLTPR